uniref:Bm13413 n=1 Tax=Brugia malayi TaxID=6279 RepID=A0A1I9G7T2_BRUMA|nr:Bm13413 [Brugia malayi]
MINEEYIWYEMVKAHEAVGVARLILILLSTWKYICITMQAKRS